MTAFNDGAATSVVTDAVLVEGGWSKAMDNDLVALRATVVGMGLAEKPTDRLTTKIDSIRHWLSLGENVCEDLDEFKAIVADLLDAQQGHRRSGGGAQQQDRRDQGEEPDALLAAGFGMSSRGRAARPALSC